MAYIYEYIRSQFGDTIREGNFYDLGSGSGKAVVAMALIHPFKKLIGIEYLENLYKFAAEVADVYEKSVADRYKSYKQLFTLTAPNKIEFYNGDFLKQKWNDTSIIFANSTCFGAELMTSIAQKANKECKPGTIIITFTKRLNSLSSDWEMRDGFKRNMTWGAATVYVHRRK